jgi:hypothetical protein
VIETLTRAERGRWTVHAHVDKFSQDQTNWVQEHYPIRGVPLQHKHFQQFGLTPEDGIVDSPGNLLLTAGLTRLMSLLNGAGGQAMTNTATRLGTGNSSTAEAIGQTDLQAAAGSANRWFQIMDATFPSVATNVLTAKATWATGDGNYVWNEWGLDIGTPTVTSGNTVNANLFNRKVASLGTKTSGTWVLTVTVTIS